MTVPRLLFILKAPMVGTVKTRLAEEIGEVRALSAYRQMVEFLFDRLASEWPFEIHFTPPEAEHLMHAWLGSEHPYFPQVGNDLGERMETAVRDAFSRGGDPVILLGGDCPHVTPSMIGEVAESLAYHDTAIGPAADGGYYLLALNRPDARLFGDIAWSTETVFTETLERIKAAGLTVKILETLEDVDDLPGWIHAESAMGTPRAASE
jgi:rSAM/selenodomain-associated transferase 1